MTMRAQQRVAWQTRFRTAIAKPAPAAPRIHLRIGAIEFHGASRSSANRIAASFESELGALLTRNGVPMDGNPAQAL